jgi:hypothetical protein
LSRLKSEKGIYIAAGEEIGFTIEELTVSKLNIKIGRGLLTRQENLG